MAVKTRVISFLWGIAEATFFFFVPDIWLTRIAIKDLREAIINAFIALIGSIMGGVILYVLGGIMFDSIRQFLELIPAISETMVDTAGKQMQEANPIIEIIKAGFTGVPFKIYATWAGYLSLSFPVFIIASTFARIVRFISLILLTCGAKRVLLPYITANKLLWLHVGIWTVFYCYYFFKMSL